MSPGPARTGGLLRSNIVVAAGTGMSRITGLARESVFAAVIGQRALADAYNGANNSPNAVYELVIGGVLAATLVPAFTRHHAEGDEEATNAVVTTSIIAIAAVTVVAVFAAPLIFHLSAVSVHDVDPGQYRAVGTALSRIFLLQIFFYGLDALFGALLNSRRRFFAPAWSSVLANLVTIAGLIYADRQLGSRDPFAAASTDGSFRLTLGLGATLGIAAMAVCQVPALYRAGIHLRFRPDFRHPAVRHVVRLSGWTFGYAAANIATVYFVKNLAKPGSGGQDAYSKAYTVFQLPHGLLAMSITTTFVPDLARLVARRDREGFVNRASLGVRMVALLTFPAALGLMALRRPIVGLLFEHGKFTGLEALTTSRAVAGFSIGLIGFSLYLFVLRGFYAHSDTRTTFVINLFECVLNVVLAVILVRPFGVLGLGLAFGLSYVICAAWALQVLSYKVPGFDLRAIYAGLGRMLLAAILAGEVMWLIARVVGANAGTGALARVAIAGTGGLIVYGAVLAALGVDELGQLTERLRRRSPEPTA